MNVQPVTLLGKAVRLQPLTESDVDALTNVGLHPELWTLQPREIATREDMCKYVSTALQDAARGFCLPFTIVDIATNGVIGSTRYADIEIPHRRLEIGWTWLTPAHQRTKANTEAKYLLLKHAFETIGAIRVVFKTDVLNEQSRRAILRLGAVQEGIFRKHMTADSGRVRDMVYFSIIDSEWPSVKAGLEQKLTDLSV